MFLFLRRRCRRAGDDRRVSPGRDCRAASKPGSVEAVSARSAATAPLVSGETDELTVASSEDSLSASLRARSRAGRTAGSVASDGRSVERRRRRGDGGVGLDDGRRCFSGAGRLFTSVSVDPEVAGLPMSP